MCLQFQVGLPARKQACAQHLTIIYRRSGNNIRLMVLMNQLSAKHLMRLAWRPLQRARPRFSSCHPLSTHFTVRKPLLARICTPRNVTDPLRLILIVSHFQLGRPRPVTTRSPIAAELDSGNSTSSNGGALRMLLNTIPVAFISNPEASSLSASINGFRPDDQTTNPIATYNQIPNHHGQGAKSTLNFLS